MCGTCKFCLGFFQIAAIGSAGMMVTVTSMFYIYGGMPPTFAMAIGFWIQYGVGWLSIYLTVYVVRVLGKGLFTTWTPKYCFCLIIAVIILYMAGGICFFVPVTQQRMIDYSHWYNKTYGRIPRFLDKFQEQYQCCGIKNYKDYKDPKIFGSTDRFARNVYNDITPNDQEWTEYQEDYRAHLISEKIAINPTFRAQYYFNVPTSCCRHDRRVRFKKCGDFVEYDPRVQDIDDRQGRGHGVGNRSIPHKTALVIVNNATGGCFEKYGIVMGNSIFQVNWMIGIIQWGSFFQCVSFFVLIWIYRLSLRAMKRDLAITLLTNEKDDEIDVASMLLDDDDDDTLFPIEKRDGNHNKEIFAIKGAESELSREESGMSLNSNTGKR